MALICPTWPLSPPPHPTKFRITTNKKKKTSSDTNQHATSVRNTGLRPDAAESAHASPRWGPHSATLGRGLRQPAATAAAAVTVRDAGPQLRNADLPGADRGATVDARGHGEVPAGSQQHDHRDTAREGNYLFIFQSSSASERASGEVKCVFLC